MKVEVTRLWKMLKIKVKVIPVVIGALGAILLKFKEYVDELCIEIHLSKPTKICLIWYISIRGPCWVLTVSMILKTLHNRMNIEKTKIKIKLQKKFKKS